MQDCDQYLLAKPSHVGIKIFSWVEVRIAPREEAVGMPQALCPLEIDMFDPVLLQEVVEVVALTSIFDLVSNGSYYDDSLGGLFDHCSPLGCVPPHERMLPYWLEAMPCRCLLGRS